MMASALADRYSDGMKLTRTEAGYVVEVPDDVVAALGLHHGDSVTLGRAAPASMVGPVIRREAVDVFRRLARPLPDGYKFDREEANAR